MKNAKIIFKLLIVLSIITISCEKETIPILDFNGFIKSQDCYIATDMKAINHPDKYYLNPDTVLYSEYNIFLYFDGKMISKGVEAKTLNNNNSVAVKYFINDLKNINITSDKIFKGGENLTDFFMKKNFNGDKLINLQPLGYAPIILSLNSAPDTEDYYTFIVEITDKYNNIFIASTDSIFISSTYKHL
ncbi:MAG: hypothetical protein PHP52_14360 [Bacteroidales bacterium]|nr:hypothetical protein [Bacteroidales bacterium]